MVFNSSTITMTHGPINIRSWEMSASGSFAALVCRCIKFVNSFQTSTHYLNQYYKIATYLISRLIVAYRRGTKSRQIYDKYVLNVDRDVSIRTGTTVDFQTFLCSQRVQEREQILSHLRRPIIINDHKRK